MAPKRPHRPNRDITIEGTSSNQKRSRRFREIFSNERFLFIVGIFAIGFGVYASIAFLSFFFTGKADCSILEQALTDRHGMRMAIQNWAGLEGAVLSQFFVNSCFGLASLGIFFLIIFFGLYLIRAIQCSRKIRVFCILYSGYCGVVSFLVLCRRLLGLTVSFTWAVDAVI